jgi:aspartyl-tRNA(Asn)/glutamyl-tRNA(Gln) amidotransferase subunit A
MALYPDEHETIEGVGRALRAGRTTCLQVLEKCFDRIEEWEPRVKAWVRVDRAGAIEQARILDEELAARSCRGPLHGIPIGVKDIIDVEGLPTAAGFGPWRERIAEDDAPIVGALRKAGAVIMGKTVTTQFAWIDPPPTRNPWALDRTPGGSSSGSAAAVAVGMCLGALGTQTGGSIIRPASFCGVCGFKPTYGQLAAVGIVPLAPSLDHPGLIARSTRDLKLLNHEYTDHFPRDWGDNPDPPPDARTNYTVEKVESRTAVFLPTRERPPRLRRLRGFYDRRATPIAREHVDRAVAALSAAGAEVIDLPDDVFDFETILRNHRVLMAAEAAAEHEARVAAHRDEYSPRILALVEEGMAIPATEYIRCSRLRSWYEEIRLLRKLGLDRGVDALVMPATIGPAPDVSTTGDPALNSPWSYLGWPAVSLPIGLSPEGLPMGLQLVGIHEFSDDEILSTASWCEDVIRRAFHASARSD